MGPDGEFGREADAILGEAEWPLGAVRVGAPSRRKGGKATFAANAKILTSAAESAVRSRSGSR